MADGAKPKHHYAGVVCKSVRNGRTCGFHEFLRMLESPADTDFGWFGDAPRPVKCTECNRENLYTRDDLVIWETDYVVGFGMGLELDKGRFGNP
jgi:hypothetical protein